MFYLEPKQILYLKENKKIQNKAWSKRLKKKKHKKGIGFSSSTTSLSNHGNRQVFSGRGALKKDFLFNFFLSPKAPVCSTLPRIMCEETKKEKDFTDNGIFTPPSCVEKT